MVKKTSVVLTENIYIKLRKILFKIVLYSMTFLFLAIDLILFLQFVNAYEPVSYLHGVTMSNQQPGTGMGWCQNVYISQSFKILSILKTTSATPNRCEILTFPDFSTVITGLSFSGNQCNMTSTVTLNASNVYSVCVYGTGSWTDYYANSATYPKDFEKAIFKNETWQQVHGTTTGYLVDASYFQSITGIIIENSSILCVSDYENTSFTGWQNITSCNILDKVNQNRSYIMHDKNSCVVNQSFIEYQNESCSYCSQDLYQNLSICNKSLNTQMDSFLTEKNMIWLSLLYIAFMVLGYYMIKTGSITSGWFLYLISIGFDFFFAGQIYSLYISKITPGLEGQLTWIFGITLFLWITAKIGSLVMLQVKAFHLK